MKKWIPCSLLLLNTSLFAAEEAPPPPESGLWQMLTMFAILVIFFYFIIIRPEQKRRQAADVQRASIKKGDRVVVMGIIGNVYKIQENTLILKMIDGSKIEVLKGAVSEVIPATDEEAKKFEKEEAIDSKKSIE